MKAKLSDTNAKISKGGRAEKYWEYQTFKPRAAAMVISPDVNVNLGKIIATYNLKGFEFGNWLNNNDRYDRVIAAESSLRDLRTIIKTKNLGINNQIGIAFGARGLSKAAAHYEPAANMINLTKEKGFGSLAHEYGHALDYNIGGFIDQNKLYSALSGGRSVAKSLPDNVGGQFRWYVNKIVDAIKLSDSYKRIKSSNDYWHRRNEIWARFFEQYVCYKLKQAKTNNTFLCKRWNTYLLDSVYLTEKDFLPLVKTMDAFCVEVAKLLNGKTKVSAKPYPKFKIAADKEKKPAVKVKAKTTKKIATK